MPPKSRSSSTKLAAPRPPLTPADIYLPSALATPHDRLTSFLHTYLSLDSFLYSHFRTRYHPFMPATMPAAHLTGSDPAGSKIAYAVVFSSTETMHDFAGLERDDEERELLARFRLDRIKTTKKVWNHAWAEEGERGQDENGEKAHEVCVSVTVLKDVKVEKRQVWSVECRAVVQDREHRPVQVPVSALRWDEVTFREKSAVEKAKKKDKEKKKESDEKMEVRYLKPLMAQMSIEFAMERDFRDDEVKSFERLLHWERIVELLKHKARIEQGFEGEVDEPLLKFGIKGRGFEMKLARGAKY